MASLELTLICLPVYVLADLLVRLLSQSFTFSVLVEAFYLFTYFLIQMKLLTFFYDTSKNVVETSFSNVSVD